MDGLMTFFGIVMIVFGILQIILFFKVWGMTNDVRKLTKHFASPDPNADLPLIAGGKFTKGQLVVCKSDGKQVKVVSEDEKGVIKCSRSGNIMYLKPEDICTWTEWLDKTYHRL
ncbi:hypothetical protein DWW79_12475 [Alistipes sp. AF17-16]|uniref:hypothetical protein n=1 Tax=Alistipes sp. AF17-16 TaxID=2292190 RepID=UPI000E4A72A8|nr:hypothetical protein [Alistipes sp. AF17-16]RHR60914.1 hypothetical protein DWW79_12475 [Alistipes sp. AF17-16]